MPDPDTILIAGDESRRLDPDLPDGGLPLLPGVQSFQVFRASKTAPELTDGKGWTYHHHMDMACWRGRLYVAWNSCERDEDVWPSRELFATSDDGAAWSGPRELFPQGISTPLRMYFFRAQNDRMLAIAGLRVGTENTEEDAKGGLIVREIGTDHRLGEVFMLQPISPTAKSPARLFSESADAGFVAACRELLADTIYLEQQDRGRLLGDRRMKWHDAANWPGGKVPGDNDKWVAGKAYTFFQRRDGVIVGISKMGWTTFSHDKGATWSQPVVPETLVTGKAKVWSLATDDGRYALVYNPSADQRFPLSITTSDDGVHFSPLRIVHGEMPIQRYAGEHRSIGPQYTRGISRWSTDHSRKEDCFWVVYSMSKEDIWVSRIPLPAAAEAAQNISDDFGETLGPIVPRWNTYCGKWSRVSIEESPRQNGHCLLLSDRDPYDYAAATRVFAERSRVKMSFEVLAKQADRGRLEIELVSPTRSARPVRVALTQDGRVTASNGSRVSDVATYQADQWLRFEVDADAQRHRYSLRLNGAVVVKDAALAEPAARLDRITFRTGEYRGIGGSNPVAPDTDKPHDVIEYLLQRVRATD